MPWYTPTLYNVRSLVRDSVRAILPGADATPANSVLRVLSDVMGALCHLTLQYIDWLSKQLLPDTAETVWLDRHGQIWLVNSDDTIGRKQATLAKGIVLATGFPGSIIPNGTMLSGSVGGLGTPAGTFQTTKMVVLSSGPTEVPVTSLDPGTVGNILPESVLGFVNPPPSVDNNVLVVTMTGGTDPETDNELRARILKRIQNPPMGGDANDYEQWALSYPGVTRAWSSPQEMGIGTMTVRFMMDDLRAGNGGFPLPEDVSGLTTYLNSVRPVTVKDLFVECPIPYPVNLNIEWLNEDTHAVHGAITQSLKNEFFVRAMPGQTWYRAWTDEGIMNAPGVFAYDLNASDAVMPGTGYMPVLGDITYG